MADKTDHIVISGISGHMPESINIEEFKQQLLDGVDLVTDDARRWPAGLHGLPSRTGKLKDIAHFDASFFGVHAKQAHFMDPQLRSLLEVTHEAMIDAGVNPAEFRGSNTGVFIGACDSEAYNYWNTDPDRINGYGVLGGSRNMFANRISYTFDFNGPSYTIDTACSSALIGLQQAFDAIHFGKCDAAIVGGVNILVNPNTSLQFHRLGMLSPDGKCKSFDSAGMGYVRSETIAAVFLQKRSRANRIYATILGAKSNNDGNKKEGISFPSGNMQKKLIRDVYGESGVDPGDVVYIEAHGTGTKAGDPQEVNAIVDVFCKDNRKTPLKIGSVKSNMGHAEAASGMCSLAKVIIAMESGTIPRNLHYSSPNTNIPGLLDGKLKVVAKNENFDGGIIGVNSLGFGGANVHVILSSNLKPKISSSKNQIPRLITVSGRTTDAVNYFLEKIREKPYDEELYALINNIHKMNIKGHDYRGFCLLDDTKFHEVGQVSPETPPIWFVFSGMGSQWAGMGKTLMNFEPFKKSIERSADTLKPYRIDLINIIAGDDETDLDNVLNSFISITSIQIALVDILALLGIEPDGMVGHSIGEIACAYADKTVTHEEAVSIAYFRGIALLDSKLPVGAMAAVGLSWEECKNRIPSDIYRACYNDVGNVTISGPQESIKKFVENLCADGIFAKAVKTSGFAFHSKYIAKAAPKLEKALEDLLPNPKTRSPKWISSSIPQSAWNSSLAQTSSAAYHTNNLLSPVYFYEATRYIPDNAIVLEIAPHGLLQSIMKRSLGSNVINISLLKKDHPDNVKFLLSSIGKIYKSGGLPNVAALYPPVSFPVGRGTPMLASMIKWDHSTEWATPNFSDKGSRSGELIVDIDLSKEEYKFLRGHIIDGRTLFPASGYVALIWKAFADLRNQDFEQLPVILEDVKFLRATLMPLEGSVKFLINIFKGTGEFEICEGGSITASGRIYTPANIKTEFLNLQPKIENSNNSVLRLNQADCYKEHKMRGYEHEGSFQAIIKADHFLTTGKLEWKNNWITFIDAMIQFYILGKNTRILYLPTGIDKLIINPQNHASSSPDLLPVYLDRNIDVMISGGVEMRRIKCSSVPRRQQIQAHPKLETYQFIPLENKASPENYDETSIFNALTIASQLVLENTPKISKLKVIEVVKDNQSDGNSLLKVQEILESEPNLNVDVTILTSTAINSKEKSIQVVSSTHLVILSRALVNKNGNDITNALSLLKPGGFILFEEPNNISEFHLLTKHSLEVVYRQVVIDKQFILTRILIEIPVSPIIVEITEKNYKWVESLKEAIQLSKTTGCKIYIVSYEEFSGVVGLINCLREEPGGNNIRGFFIQDKNIESFSLTSKFYTKEVRKDLVQNVYKDGVWGTFRHLLLQQNGDNSKFQAEHAYINTLTRADLSSLQWIEGPLKFYKGDNMTSNLCKVFYAPLNFRDVMLATGKLSPDALPGDLAEQDCLFGLEFSGMDCRGRRVMGMVAAKSLATTVLSDPDFLWDVPKDWSLEAAATIPVVYGTSYYALIIRGNMQPRESILIHAGAGGVGQASISIALQMGCKVYTTVGNQSKRDFLKKRFPKLTDDNIGYSRDTSFEYWILAQTNGRGVDLVLNSLAGEQLQASVRCLAPGGRFLEIGKVDLFNNTPLGMSVFLKNTTFHGILLDAVFATEHTDKIKLKQLIYEGISSGAVRPLPNTIFAEHEAEKAFRFLISGKNIGKVSLKIRDENSPILTNPSLKTVSAIRKAYMNPEKVYVLVGGLGGFGLELTKWLITRGATKIVLSSRSGVKSGYQSLCLRKWKDKNIIVHVLTTDVTTSHGAKELLNKCNTLGPVGGVFNLAAVLRDSLLINQTEKDFEVACNPKINVTKHLDVASRILTPQLDYFVVFSSVACGKGNAGQSNYGFANSAMERICENRHAIGLPALAIQWGCIGDVGMVAESMHGVTEIAGTLLQSLSSCLSTIDSFLQQPHPVVSSLVLADKRKSAKNIDRVKLTNAVANILGLKDVRDISHGYTLVDVGMDSLMSTEIKQTLERDYDLELSLQEISELTIGGLLKLEAESISTYMSNNKADNKIISQFEGHLVPTSPCIKMISREITDGNPVFMLPHIEGTVNVMKDLALGIDTAVYGLQYTAVPFTSIAELASYYINEVKTVQAEGPYKLIGYSFGACLAFEIGIQLEVNDEEVNLILLDGSPEYVPTHLRIIRNAETDLGDIESEHTEVVLFFIRKLIEADTQQLAVELAAMKSWDQKVKRATELISSVTSYPPDEIEVSINNFYKRLIAADSYRPTTTFNGKVMLFKASENDVQIDEDYELNIMCRQNITIKVLEGTHSTIVSKPSLGVIINNFFTEKKF